MLAGAGLPVGQHYEVAMSASSHVAANPEMTLDVARSNKLVRVQSLLLAWLCWTTLPEAGFVMGIFRVQYIS